MNPNPAVDHVWTWLCVVMATQTVLTNQMRTSVDLPPLCPYAHLGNSSVQMESVCQPAVFAMDGWTVALLMDLMSKVNYQKTFSSRNALYQKLASAAYCKNEFPWSLREALCPVHKFLCTFNDSNNCELWWTLLFSAQTVVWFVMKGSSCVRGDDVFCTSIDAMATMTVGTSVMREGVYYEVWCSALV